MFISSETFQGKTATHTARGFTHTAHVWIQKIYLIAESCKNYCDCNIFNQSASSKLFVSTGVVLALFHMFTRGLAKQSANPCWRRVKTMNQWRIHWHLHRVFRTDNVKYFYSSSLMKFWSHEWWSFFVIIVSSFCTARSEIQFVLARGRLPRWLCCGFHETGWVSETFSYVVYFQFRNKSSSFFLGDEY